MGRWFIALWLIALLGLAISPPAGAQDRSKLPAGYKNCMGPLPGCYEQTVGTRHRVTRLRMSAAEAKAWCTRAPTCPEQRKIWCVKSGAC
jgi:hypothetical protein